MWDERRSGEIRLPCCGWCWLARGADDDDDNDGDDDNTGDEQGDDSALLSLQTQIQ